MQQRSRAWREQFADGQFAWRQSEMVLGIQ
jgi:hypothetical protein